MATTESETQEESLSDSGVSCGRMRCRKMTLRQCWRILARMLKAGANADCRFPQRAAEAHHRAARTSGARPSDAPYLLSDVCAREDAAVTLSRITALLVGIVNHDRLKNCSLTPRALKHLISLCAVLPMIASQLARYPLLLDELLIETPFTSRW
ncbi:hypothetical protein ACNKHT_19940 [Shigella flexneri]